MSAAPGNTSRAPLLLAGGLALLVALLAAAWWLRSRPVEAPAPVEPAGPVAGATILEGPEARFTWARDVRASVYRIEAYDDSGKLLAAGVLRDTSLSAAALLPDTARTGTWRVVVVTAGGTEIRPSEPAPFDRR